MAQLQSDTQKEVDKQVYLLKKVMKESQQSARSLFNEKSVSNPRWIE
jgi:hypothetical protein